MNARHSIHQKDRSDLHDLFRKLLYAKPETEYDEEMQNLLGESDLVVSKLFKSIRTRRSILGSDSLMRKRESGERPLRNH